MNDTAINYREKIDAGITYENYRTMIDELMDNGKTTGTNHSDEYLHYTNLNVTRMSRHDKKTVLNADLIDKLHSVNKSYTWLVLTEAWCGDAAQNIPIIAKMAEENDNIDLKLILRDEHLDLMDAHLTDGGRSIPKMVIIDNDTMEVAGEWGPRPAPVQKMMLDYKYNTDPNKPPYSELSKEVQHWYIRDKSQTIQGEFVELLSTL